MDLFVVVSQNAYLTFGVGAAVGMAVFSGILIAVDAMRNHS